MTFREFTGVFLLGAALIASPATAQSGPLAVVPQKLVPGTEGTPVVAVPVSGAELEPATILEDSTHKVSGEKGDTPFPHHLDIEGNFLFYATGQGMQIYDISTPASPFFSTYTDASSVAPYWGAADTDFFMKMVDAPPGNTDVVATSNGANGFIVIDARDKSRGKAHYQDAQGRTITNVYATNIGGTDYAFAAASAGAFLLYDLDSAAGYAKCLENTEDGIINCPGVFKGEIARAVTSIRGIDDMVVTRLGNTTFEVYRITNPSLFANAQPRMAGTLPASLAGAADMFKYDYNNDNIDEYYVAAIGSTFVSGQMRTWLWIYDVSCARIGNCAAPNWLAEYVVTDFSKITARQHFLSVSYDGGKPYLYVGNANVGAPGVDNCVDQREFLIDLSKFSPSNPPTLDAIEITPQGITGGYWGWYYQACHVNGVDAPPGFNDTQPRYAKVKNGYVFRAAFSFGDSHRIAGASTATPTADFSWETPPWYDGVQFSNASEGFPAVDQLSWTFTDAPPTSVSNPLVTFSSPGVKTVSLMAHNSNGWSTPNEKMVTTLDPDPDCTSAIVDVPVSADVCSQVTASVTGCTGRDLFYDWTFDGGTPVDPNHVFSDGFESGDTTSWTNVQVPPSATLAPRKIATPPTKELVNPGCGNTPTCQWSIPATQIIGDYVAKLTVTSTSSVGQALQESASFAVTEGAVVVATQPTTDPDPPDSNAVTFVLTLQGATEWRWNWGDGTPSVWTGDTTDPEIGLNPTHVYATSGPQTVTVDFRKCGDDATIESSLPLEIDVPEPVNLNIFWFDILCQGSCIAVSVGDTVTVSSLDEGNPTGYEYDWDADGIFEDVRAAGDPNTPATSHTFTTGGGCRTPVMKITRGAASATKPGDLVCVN